MAMGKAWARRFVTSGSVATKLLEAGTVWRWLDPNNVPETVVSQNHEDKQEPWHGVQHLMAPVGAELVEQILQDWKELDGAALPVNEENAVAKLTRVRDIGDMYNRKQLMALFLKCMPAGDAGVLDTKVDLLIQELESGHSRIFMEVAHGRIAKVRDYIIISIHAPDRTEEILIQETLPLALPVMHRLAHQSLIQTAELAVKDLLPPVFKGLIKFEPFQPEHGVWMVPDLNASMARQPSPTAMKELPTMRRYFKLRAVVEEDADPVELLKVGIGIE